MLMSCRQADVVADGDLLFCIADEDNAITDVTQGIDGMKIEHVGIYYNKNVIEATKSRGVCLTPIDSFISNNGRRVIIGRVDNADVKQSIENALKYKGLPYDTLFMPDNRAMYCSASGTITSFWIDFYKQRGMEVPEGWPGSNPGELSRRECVKIIRRW